MNGNRNPGYERFTRVLRGAVSSQPRIQPKGYRAITMGPRHTFGPVLLQSQDFGDAPIASVDTRGSGVNDLGVMAARNSVLLTPRAPLVGFYDGDLAVGVPSLPAGYDAATVVISPVIDLLLWTEKRDEYPYRGDDTYTFELTDGENAAVPCFARRRVSITLDCVVDGTVEIYAGNASATNVHDIGTAKIASAMVAGQRETFELHELIDVSGASPFTPTGLLATSRPDWLYFDIANTATFVITIYASDDR